jgi:AcrR family transcriptional regulator
MSQRSSGGSLRDPQQYDVAATVPPGGTGSDATFRPLPVGIDGGGGSQSRPGSGTGEREIIEAAAVVFSKNGYGATSIDDIADELGATKGRVYHYYRAKADIFLDVVVAGMCELVLALHPIAVSAQPSDVRLMEMTREHARLMMTRQSFQRVAVEAVELHLLGKPPADQPSFNTWLEIRDYYEHLFAVVIANGQRDGSFRGVDTSIATKTVLGALNWISIWYDSSRGDPAAVDVVAEEYATFVVNGLREIR